MEGLSPRYYLGFQPQLERRQSGACAAGAHSCLDINSTVCCLDTQYCYIDPNNNPKCCAIGSNCDSICSSSQYQCEVPATISGIATVSPACCGRTCTSVSAFKCASDDGGGCCSYGSLCATGGNCVSTAQPTTSNAVVSEIPVGCTTSQIACPTSIGGGCCNVGQSCTVLDNTNYCTGASGSSSAVRTGLNGVLASAVPNNSGTSGLSTGTKAGIGAGVALLCCLVIGGLLWFCVVHRRRARLSEPASAPDTSEKSGTRGSKSRPSGTHQGSDYFVPTAASGPYTENHASSGISPGFNRGVPVTPQNPSDITAPVEIDSREHSNVASPGEGGQPMMEYLKMPETTEYRVELP